MRFFVIFPLTVIAAMLSVAVLGYRLNMTASLPLGVYRQVGVIRRGSFALFCLDDEAFIRLAKERGYLGEGRCPGGVKQLGKKIFALTGDEISFSGGPGGQIAVNGQFIPASLAKKQDSHGRAMLATRLAAGRIPPGLALMLSPHHAGGFDSRYFGLVKLSALKPVQPVFIWE